MKKNQRYRGFVAKNVWVVDEIHVKVTEILHEKTGARIIHVAADDDENLFALCFKTYPKDHSGVAHILEHTTLCGSKKYPIHDPFFSMLRRSSNTFMNAFTAKLWTCYPAATRIKKDFYNLYEVYLDSVFHPLLLKTSFQQEGHRLEFDKPDDPSSPLKIKGVVYNEMKGVLANPGSLFYRKLMSGLCPDHTYGFDSGGDPKEITSLSHADLIKFHEEYYHPSRCTYFFYGDIPIENHLDYLGEKVLDEANSLSPIPAIEKCPRITAPVKELSYYPSHEKNLKQQTFVGFAWLTMDIKDQDDLLGLHLIDSILMDTDASLLKYKLTESGLCIEADSAFDPDARDVPYTIVCRGCEPENADALEKILFESLKEIAAEKIPMELIESSMHQLEFSRSEISYDYEPYGLELFSRIVLPYLQGGSPIDGLKIHSLFERLSTLVAQKDYLSNIIEKYLINNPHRYRLVMAPDTDLSEKMHKEEESFLQEKQQSLSSEEIQTILKESLEIQEDQQRKEEEDINCLPILGLDDLPKQVSFYPVEKEQFDQLVVHHHSCFTNHILYADLVFDLPQIEEADLPYLRLFASMLTELGAGGRDYIKNLQYIHKNIGGVWTSLSLNVQRENIQSCYPTISLSGKALVRKSKELFQLMKDFILTPDLSDKERIKELVTQTHINLQNRLNNNAIGYALKQSASGFSSWNFVSNLWHGMPYYKFIENLSQNLDTEIDALVLTFQRLSKSIFHLNNPHLILSCDSETYKDLAKNHFYGLDKFSDASASFHPWVELATPRPMTHSARMLATPIAHNALSLATVTMTSPYSAPLKLASYLFENNIIHKKVREEGGAYTSGVKYNILTGIYQFYSSRDPHIFSSFKAFETAIAEIAHGNFTEQDLLEAKLSYIQDVDGVVSPGSKASVTYFQYKTGLSREYRQKFRDQILSATKQDVQEAVTECLRPKINDDSIRVTFASKPIIERDNALFLKAGLPKMKVESL